MLFSLDGNVGDFPGLWGKGVVPLSQCVSAEYSWDFRCALAIGCAEERTKFLLDSERLGLPVAGSGDHLKGTLSSKNQAKRKGDRKDLYCYHTQLGEEGLNCVES